MTARKPAPTKAMERDLMIRGCSFVFWLVVAIVLDVFAGTAGDIISIFALAFAFICAWSLGVHAERYGFMQPDAPPEPDDFPGPPAAKP